MTASTWLMATPALVMLGAAVPAAADPVTFAQFIEQSNVPGSNFAFTNNNDGTGTLNTANTTQGDAIFFSFDNTIAGLPADLMGQLSANLLINGGQGVTTSDAASYSGHPHTYVQPFSGPLTISFTLTTPVMFQGQTISNLLTMSLLEGGNGDPQFAGGGHSGGLASNNTNFALSYSSDLLLFRPGALLDFALAFSAVNGITGISDNILSSFIANGSGTIDSDPPPEVPEPASLAMLAVGALACAAGVFWRPGQVPAQLR